MRLGQALANCAALHRAGDVVSLSGVIAVDPARKLVVKGHDAIPSAARALLGETGVFSTDIKEVPILAQGWFVLDRIRTNLETPAGRRAMTSSCCSTSATSPTSPLPHFPRYGRGRKLCFTGELPASTVVEVSAMRPTADILIEVEATAFLPFTPASPKA